MVTLMMTGSLNNRQVSKAVGWPRQQCVSTYCKLVQRLNALVYHKHWLIQGFASLFARETAEPFTITRQTVVTCNRDFFRGWRGEMHIIWGENTQVCTHWSYYAQPWTMLSALRVCNSQGPWSQQYAHSFELVCVVTKFTQWWDPILSCLNL